jgi:signal transduction histidine kinase
MKRRAQRKYYELICRESDRLTRLVENVLDFARIEDGRR